MTDRDVCRGCGAEVLRHITIGAKIRDLEPGARPDGNTIIVEHEGRIRARVLSGDEMPAQQEAFKAHQCPPKERPGPPCAACLLPMHRELAISERWTTHPACDPEHHIERLRRRRAG
jgi:hypothetical protein